MIKFNQKIKDKPNVLDETGSVSDSWEIKLPPGVYEFNDIINYIQQKNFYNTFPNTDPEFKLNIKIDTKSMKSLSTTSNSIQINSEIKKLLRFTKADYPAGTHK